MGPWSYCRTFFSQDILQTNSIQQWYLGVGHRAHKASHLQAGWNGYILLDKFMLFHELDNMIFGFGTCNFHKKKLQNICFRKQLLHLKWPFRGNGIPQFPTDPKVWKCCDPNDSFALGPLACGTAYSRLPLYAQSPGETGSWISWIQRDPDGSKWIQMDPNGRFQAVSKLKILRTDPGESCARFTWAKLYLKVSSDDWIPLLLFTPSEILAESCKDRLLSKCWTSISKTLAVER